MTQWWVNEGGFPGILPGSNYGGGAGNTAASGGIQFRGPLDAARAAGGRLPQAEYPDGYLGNIIDRHTDKLLQTVKNRLTDQSYQRGVHKGSRIAPKQYFWPEEYDPDPSTVRPMAGLDREAQGVRVGNVIQVPRGNVQRGNPVEMLAHMGKTSGMATPGEVGRKMEEARQFGVNPALNPVVIQSPGQLNHFTNMMPRYGTAGARG